MNEFIRQVVSLLKVEYMERQKLVVVEFQKRSALLKRQQKLQMEIIKEISEKMRDVDEKKCRCRLILDKCENTQVKIKDE